MQRIKNKQASVVLEASKNPFTIPELAKKVGLTEKGVYSCFYNAKKMGVTIERVDGKRVVLEDDVHKRCPLYVVKTNTEKIKEIYGLVPVKRETSEYWFILTR